MISFLSKKKPEKCSTLPYICANIALYPFNVHLACNPGQADQTEFPVLFLFVEGICGIFKKIFKEK